MEPIEPVRVVKKPNYNLLQFKFKSECICQVIIAFIFATFYLRILPNIRKGHHSQQSPPFLMQKFSPSHINKLRINLYIQAIISYVQDDLKNFNLYKQDNE